MYEDSIKKEVFPCFGILLNGIPRTEEYITFEGGTLVHPLEFADTVSLEMSGILTFPHKSMLEFLIEAGAIKEDANNALRDGPFQKSASANPGCASQLK
jgi:hypothetical protein